MSLTVFGMFEGLFTFEIRNEGEIKPYMEIHGKSYTIKEILKSLGVKNMSEWIRRI